MDTSLLQGLALLETQDGAKSIKGPNGEDSNNLFNIKDNSGAGFKAFDKVEGSHDAYRTYDTREDSIQDLMGLLDRKYPDAVTALQNGDATGFATALKSGGYATDPNYVNKLTGAIQRARATSTSDTGSQGDPVAAIQHNILAGDPATAQLASLRGAGWGPDIDSALQNGWAPSDIVRRIGGQKVDDLQATADKVKAESIPTTALNVAGDTLKSGVNGLQQAGDLVTGDDAALKQRQAEQTAADADPMHQARMDTTTGMLTNAGVKALPALAGAVATGGGSILGQAAMQGAIGAGQGFLTPTTADGQRLGNTVTDGAMGAVGGGLGAALGKGIGSATQIGMSPERSATAQALMADAKTQGLPVRVMDVNPMMKAMAAGLGDNSTVAASNATVDLALARKIGEGLGLQDYAGPIDHEMLAAAKPAIQANLDNATNISVTLPQSLKAELAPLASGTNNPLTAGIASNSVVRQAVDNLTQAIDTGAPIAGKSLQELNSELKALASNMTASASERQAASHLVGRINTAMTDAMTPEQATAFQAANKQWANLKTTERMVAASNDTGSVTPRQIIQAGKVGRTRSAFLNGEAPFQELGGTAADLYGPASNHGLANVIGGALDAHGSPLGTALALTHPHVGLPALAAKYVSKQLLSRIATSQNPTLLRLATGGTKGLDPVITSYIAKALGAGGAAAATN